MRRSPPNVLAFALVLALAGSACGQSNKPGSTAAGDKVFVTKSGAKYHWSRACKGLKNATTVSRISLSAAKQRGLKVCDLCTKRKATPPASKSPGKGGG